MIGLDPEERGAGELPSSDLDARPMPTRDAWSAPDIDEDEDEEWLFL
jgi:hypothetical protein